MTVFIQEIDKDMKIRQIEKLIEEYSKDKSDNNVKTLLTAIMLRACDGNRELLKKEIYKGMILQGDECRKIDTSVFIGDLLDILEIVLGKEYSKTIEDIIKFIQPDDDDLDDLPFL